MRFLLALAALFLVVPQAFAAIRTHGTLQSCIMTIGNFCPIESIGFSLLGTAAIAIVLFGVGFLWRAATGSGRSSHTYSPPPSSQPQTGARTYAPQGGDRFAKVNALVARGEYVGAFEELEPMIGKGDREAEAMLPRISKKSADRGERSTVAAALLKSEDFPVAFKYLYALAREGDTSAQYIVAVLYDRGLGTEMNPLEGMKWMALAAKHGDDRAIEKMAKGGGIPSDWQPAIEGFVSAWRPVETA